MTKIKKMIYAKDKKCVVCGEQADIFFGLADPNAEQQPYCNPCKEKAMINIYDMMEKLRKE